MKKTLVSLVLTFLVACSSLPSVNSQLKIGYDTVSAFVDLTKNGLARGRLSVTDAERGSLNAKKAQATLDRAGVALAECKQTTPCDKYTDILKSLQPDLLAFELELRKAQGEVK